MLLLALVALIALALDVMVLWEPVSSGMALSDYDQPARVTGQPARLAVGQPGAEEGWRSTWRASGYLEVEPGKVVGPRRFAMAPGQWQVHPASGELLAVTTAQGRIASIVRVVDQVPVPAWDFPLPTIALIASEDPQRRAAAATRDLPAHLLSAVLAAQDPQFRSHHGLHLGAQALSGLERLIRRPGAQRPATITRQLARDMFGSSERTWQRLAQEAVIAVILDYRYSKDELLAAYLNKVRFGERDGVPIVGIIAAARLWFGKDAATLAPEESVLLAGTIASRAGPAAVSQPTNQLILASAGTGARAARPWFVEDLLSELQPRFGLETLHRDGLELRTTLDPMLQSLARGALQQGLADLRQEHPGWWQGDEGPKAALIAMDPRDGAIRAIVGGSSDGSSAESLATTRLGTAGSAFKPIVLAAAIAEQWPALGPLSEVRDEPLALAGPGLPDWRNDDGAFLGRVSLRTATERSRNPPFVRLGIAVGPRRLAETARALGIKTPLEASLSLALGEAKLSLLDLAVAYATLANGGVRPEPRLLEGVRSAQGAWLEHPMPKSDGAIDPRVASVVTTLLEGVVNRGTAYSVRKLGFLLPVAGNTGLSAAKSDAWMVGYTPDLVVALWLGADGVGRLAGAEQGVAVPMWTRFLLAAEPYLQGGAFRQPPGTELAGSPASSSSGNHPRQRHRLEAEDRQRRQEERRATQLMERGTL